MKQKFFYIFIILFLQSCASKIYSYLEDVEHKKVEKITFVKALKTAQITSDVGMSFNNKVINKGEAFELRTLIDGRKVVIIDNDRVIGVPMVAKFTTFFTDRGILVGENLCYLGKLYQFTPTKLGNDEFLITNDEKKSRFKVSEPSLCFTITD